MLSNYDVLKTILITEKGTVLGEQSKYTFKVDPRANKMQIKRAVEDIYKVKVAKVNTMTVQGKFKRLRQQGGYTSKWNRNVQ